MRTDSKTQVIGLSSREVIAEKAGVTIKGEIKIINEFIL